MTAKTPHRIMATLLAAAAGLAPASGQAASGADFFTGRKLDASNYLVFWRAI
jgi:hypothetical protein